MPLIVCPSCGPETLCYSGRVIMRICDACRDSIREGVNDLKEGRTTPWSEVKRELGLE